MAASKVNNRDKPVIGVNSDPTKSVGHLCLPSKYSNKFDEVIELLKLGKFQWQYKQRLRVTLIGEAAEEEPKELNDIRYDLKGINQFLDQDDSQDQTSLTRSRSPLQHSLQMQNPLNSGRYPAVLPPNSTTTSMSQTDIAQLAKSQSGQLNQQQPMDTDDPSHKHQQPQKQQVSSSPKHSNTSSNTNSELHNSSSSNESPSLLHNQQNATSHQFQHHSHSMSDSVSSSGTSTDHHHDFTQSGFDMTRKSFKTVDGKTVYKIRELRERALNEVFVGETLSARVSYYELSVDNNRLIKMKSSGLTVCTGTGSTSWYYNINKLTEQQMQSIVSIINKVTTSTKVPTDNLDMIGEITRQFNQTLTFPSTEPIMAYSIRDPVDYASAMGHSHRGHAKRIEVKSRMQNACLVLDGCQFYPFNDGSYALMEMYDEDALKTISID